LLGLKGSVSGQRAALSMKDIAGHAPACALLVTSKPWRRPILLHLHQKPTITLIASRSFIAR